MSYYLHSIQNVTSYSGSTFSRDFTNFTKMLMKSKCFIIQLSSFCLLEFLNIFKYFKIQLNCFLFSFYLHS